MIRSIGDHEIASIEAAAIAQMEDNGHSLISPSGASTWMGCVASVIGIHEHRQIAPDNEASIEGTCAHFLLELCLLFRISPLDIQHLGHPGGVVPPDNYLDDVTRWHTRIINTDANPDDVILKGIQCREWASEITFPPDMRMEIAKGYDLIMQYVHDGWTMIPEMKVKLRAYLGHDQCDGTSDVALYRVDEMIIVDLKYGIAIEVSPVENKQERIYAGGAVDYVYKLTGIVINKLTLVIMQSRINDGVWKVWETTYVELHKWLIEEVKPASLRSLYAIGHPNEVEADWFNPSTAACKWCHRATDCSSRRKMVEDSVIEAFALARTVPETKGSLIPLPFDGKKISDADLTKVLDNMPFILAWFKDADKEGLRRVRRGADIGGRKMVQGRMQRKWRIGDEHMVKEFNELGLTPDLAFNLKLKSPAQIEASPIPSDIKKSIMDCVVSRRGNDVLALASDVRPVVNMITKAQNAFKDVGK